MKKTKIVIHNEKNCSWCEIFGQFIYGKNQLEVTKALDMLAEKEPWLIEKES